VFDQIRPYNKLRGGSKIPNSTHGLISLMASMTINAIRILLEWESVHIPGVKNKAQSAFEHQVPKMGIESGSENTIMIVTIGKGQEGSFIRTLTSAKRNIYIHHKSRMKSLWASGLILGPRYPGLTKDLTMEVQLLCCHHFLMLFKMI